MTASPYSPEIIERGNRLKQLLKMGILSNKVFCKKYDIGLSTLNQWIHGHMSGLTKQGAKKIADAMYNEGVECDLQWLIHGLETPPKHLVKAKPSPKEIPLPLPETSSDITTTTDELILIQHEIELYRKLHNYNIITYVVQDITMEPALYMGDIVAGIPVTSPDNIKQCINEICIVRTDQNLLLCRKLLTSTKGNGYKLESLNQMAHTNLPDLSNVNVTLAAKVSRIWRS